MPRTASLVISGNRVLASSEVPGVHFESEQLPNGVQARIVVEPEVRLATPVHLCFGMLPAEGVQEIIADYASLGLTLGRHPLALLRRQLDQKQLLRAVDLKTKPHGAPAKVAGLVTCRQRPDTASGVVFVTLEDETGCMNIVVWRRLVERQRRELLGARLMAVHGRVERDGDVVHLVAARLLDYSGLLGPLAAASRDFH